jgi:VDE lipocalin domain
MESSAPTNWIPLQPNFSHQRGLSVCLEACVTNKSILHLSTAIQELAYQVAHPLESAQPGWCDSCHIFKEKVPLLLPLLSLPMSSRCPRVFQFKTLLVVVVIILLSFTQCAAFGPRKCTASTPLSPGLTRSTQQRAALPISSQTRLRQSTHLAATNNSPTYQDTTKTRNPLTSLATSAAVGLASLGLILLTQTAAFAENELSAKYGGGFDSSLVDQTCLVNHCAVQAKACLQDDPSCRKGLTCTAKCLGDNACITGCMARYGTAQLDNLLKCTIEDHECIKVAILPGGADDYGSEPPSPAPTVPNFKVASLEGSWYKVVGYNPNYDCYACQRNTFAIPSPDSSHTNWLSKMVPFSSSSSSSPLDRLEMDVEFSMPHLLPDGSPPPPSGVQETVWLGKENSNSGGSGSGGWQSMALNDYRTHETMIFDAAVRPLSSNSAAAVAAPPLVLAKGTSSEASFARTAHSEGEMFGLSTYKDNFVCATLPFGWVGLTNSLCRS